MDGTGLDGMGTRTKRASRDEEEGVQRACPCRVSGRFGRCAVADSPEGQDVPPSTDMQQ